MTKKEFIKLSWKLLEAKVLYYLFPARDNISDAEYDTLERQYLKGCDELKEENTIQNMVGIDQTRPSVHIVIRKIMRTYEEK